MSIKKINLIPVKKVMVAGDDFSFECDINDINDINDIKTVAKIYSIISEA